MTPHVRALRPWQWGKNLFVFAPLFFAHRWADADSLLRAAAAAAIFCLLASGIYLVNDVRDAEADRLHPKKRFRPIAAGELTPTTALAMAAALQLGALAWAWFGLESPPVAAVCGIYLVIQWLYSWRLKHIVILDVLCIASGFVLRLLCGGFAVGVDQSPWILVCTVFLSLLLALCKRRHEVTTLGADAAGHRASLGRYPPAFVNQLIGIATSATLVTYALYTVDDRTLRVHGLPEDAELPPLAATIPFVIYGVFRYLYLVHREDGGGDPAATLARDWPSLLNVVLYLLVVVLVTMS